jgi:peroxiredoxin
VAAEMEHRSKLLEVGERAPEFRLPAAQGGEVALSDFRDQKNVILVFLTGMT